MQFATDTADARARDKEWVELIQQIAEGDQNALATLYDTTNRLVFGLILRVLSDTSIAEEVLLDVYTQVWRQASNYDTQRGTPLAWLTTIARSRAIDRLRSGWQDQQRKDPIETLGDTAANAASPEEMTVASERQRFVRAALESLSPEQREVIELAYYSGLSHSEIAAKLNQPLGTVKTRTRLGMMKLREALTPILGDDR
ncbi:MAG TPA: sigma-70 family RNA polymerase sigma factor [Blastocatellia bacterium]|nr:sigma-70 family RNA polymerase sigma factor [Blastocatellia bacterium]